MQPVFRKVCSLDHDVKKGSGLSSLVLWQIFKVLREARFKMSGHARPGIARTTEEASALRSFFWHYTSPSKTTLGSGAISQEDLLSEGGEEGQGINEITKDEDEP